MTNARDVPGIGWGAKKTKTLAQPAAGVEFADLIVPINTKWRITGWSAALTTGIAVANRAPALAWKTGAGNIYNRAAQGGIIAASSVATFGYGLRLAPNIVNFTLAANAVSIAGLPDEVMSAGDILSSTTIGIAAADQWSIGYVRLEEWLQVMP